jgi:hypothetical protein
MADGDIRPPGSALPFRIIRFLLSISSPWRDGVTTVHIFIPPR